MWEYMYPDELYHHGTKGMKWGKRLYQNKDGSLTPLGKIRYRTNKDFKKEVDRNRGLAKARAAREAKKTVEEKRAELLRSVDAKEIYANKHLLTTQELNDRINRIDTEARLQSKIVTEHQQTGRDIVNSKMDSAKTTLDKAVGLYKSIDGAYTTVTSSAIGKVLAKKLGLEPPRKEFDLDDFVKNINKKTTQEIQDVAKRVTNEKIIRDRMDALKPKDDAAAKQAEWKKQVDEYNQKWQEEATRTVNSEPYRKSGDDIIDNKTGTGNKSNSNVLLLEDKSARKQIDAGDAMVKRVDKSKSMNDKDTLNMVQDGEKYVYDANHDSKDDDYWKEAEKYWR